MFLLGRHCVAACSLHHSAWLAWPCALPPKIAHHLASAAMAHSNNEAPRHHANGICHAQSYASAVWYPAMARLSGKAHASLTCSCASTVCPNTRFRIGGAVEILAWGNVYRWPFWPADSKTAACVRGWAM
eukprot:scaffold6139_cov15-Tisochrysis_lutea.AAC.1